MHTRPPLSPHPPIGVAVITRNRRDGLLHTLDQLAALPERPPVVVIDNASNDGTAAAVRTRRPDVRARGRDRSGRVGKPGVVRGPGP